jgi:hypothetical protein
MQLKDGRALMQREPTTHRWFDAGRGRRRTAREALRDQALKELLHVWCDGRPQMAERHRQRLFGLLAHAACLCDEVGEPNTVVGRWRGRKLLQEWQ